MRDDGWYSHGLARPHQGADGDVRLTDPLTTPSRRLSGRAQVLLVAVILLLLGWLVLKLGWTGLLIAWAASAVLLEISARRRRKNRS